MKYKFQYLLIIYCLCISCNNESEIENIEYMSYRWELNDSLNSFYVRHIKYASINKNGDAEIIYNGYFDDDNVSYYKGHIDLKPYHSLKISEVEKSVSSTQTSGFDDSPLYKIKILYNDNSSKLIRYDKSIHKQWSKLINDIEKIRKNNTVNNTDIHTKRKEFTDFIMHQDTLFLPLPPIPIKEQNLPVKISDDVLIDKTNT